MTSSAAFASKIAMRKDMWTRTQVTPVCRIFVSRGRYVWQIEVRQFVSAGYKGSTKLCVESNFKVAVTEGIIRIQPFDDESPSGCNMPSGFTIWNFPFGRYLQYEEKASKMFKEKVSNG